MIIIALSTSFIATVLLQKGLQVIESTTASIFCLLEPISSFIVGMAFQGETLTLLKVVGFGLIIGSILIITLEKNPKEV